MSRLSTEELKIMTCVGGHYSYFSHQVVGELALATAFSIFDVMKNTIPIAIFTSCTDENRNTVFPNSKLDNDKKRDLFC